MPIDLPFHPIFVHFPIALFITALMAELISHIPKKIQWHETALRIYVIASLMTPLAVLTGLWEESELHLAHPVLTLHKTFAFLTMGFALTSLPIFWFLIRKKIQLYRWIFLVFLFLIVIFVVCAAYNGGRMVYEYGVGIRN